MMNGYMYLQTLEINHQDIRPENIFLTNSGEVKLSETSTMNKKSSFNLKFIFIRLLPCPLQRIINNPFTSFN